MNVEHMQSAGRNLHIFVPDDVVMLVHFQFAGLSVEIPLSTLLQWDDDHRLRWIKPNEFAVQINPCPTHDSMFIHGEKVRVGNHSGAVHFVLEMVFSIDSLLPNDVIHVW